MDEYKAHTPTLTERLRSGSQGGRTDKNGTDESDIRADGQLKSDYMMKSL